MIYYDLLKKYHSGRCVEKQQRNGQVEAEKLEGGYGATAQVLESCGCRGEARERRVQAGICLEVQLAGLADRLM